MPVAFETVLSKQSAVRIAPVTQTVTVPAAIARVSLGGIMQDIACTSVSLRVAREKVTALEGLLPEDAPMLRAARRYYETQVSRLGSLRAQALVAQAA